MIVSMQILVSLFIVLVTWGVYSKKWSKKILVDYTTGRRFYRNRKRSNRLHNFLFSTTGTKEITILVISLLFSCGVLLLCNVTMFRQFVENSIDFISTLTYNHSLIVSILGAFIALWGIYFIVHLKFFIGPTVFYTYPADQDKKTFMWYIENRSIFDAVNINVSVFKCKQTHGGVLYDPLKLTCSTIAYMSGRFFPTSNKILVKLKPREIKIDDIINHNFDFLEINITAVHALSNVVTVWSTKYNIEDIYYAQIQNNVLVSNRAGLKTIEINTLRTNMCKRFMISRKIVTYSTLLLLVLLILNLGFRNESISLPAWLEMLNCGTRNGLACVIILFSIIRFLMQLPVISTLADAKYKPYRVEIK